MGYALGIDLGTTYSAAAVCEDDRAEIFQLGTRIASIPSVVALRDDGTVVTGEGAERRARTEPERTAREFKRRLGDPVPLLLGGTPFGAEALSAHLLKDIVAAVTAQRGATPDAVVLTHPANYGPYKVDLMRETARLADVADATFITEPQAAAVHYAENQHLEVGEVVAVYDFGGGTFDAALVRKTVTGFELLGTPAGMERFGGIDLDQAVFGHVLGVLGDEAVAADDDESRIALTAVLDECRLAKEALSLDTDVTITAALPAGTRQVRLTRTEFEDMVRPRLAETMASLRRAAASAGMDFTDVARVLLVGGSSRIPAVAEAVRTETGLPVAVDAHPKHAIALGAALSGRDHLAPPALPADGTARWEDIQAALRAAQRSIDEA